jgi:hypothetical protein
MADYDKFFIDESEPKPLLAKSAAPVAARPVVAASAPIEDAGKETEDMYAGKFFIDEDEVPPNRFSPTPEQVAAVAGGLTGAVAGSYPAPSGNTAAARFLEHMYGAPKGSLADLSNLQNPASMNSLAAQVAERYAPEELPKAKPILGSGAKWNAALDYGKVINPETDTVKSVVSRGYLAENQGKVSGSKTAKALRHLAELKQKAQIAAEAAPAEIAATTAAAQNRQAFQDEATNRIRGAGSAARILQNALSTGVNVGSGIFGGLRAYQGLADMQQQGLSTGNALQTVEGGGALYGTRNPKVGLPIAGAAGATQAARDMMANGINPTNAASALSSVGVAAAPWHPLKALAAQIPAAAMQLGQYLKENPEKQPRMNVGFPGMSVNSVLNPKDLTAAELEYIKAHPEHLPAMLQYKYQNSTNYTQKPNTELTPRQPAYQAP